MVMENIHDVQQAQSLPVKGGQKTDYEFIIQAVIITVLGMLIIYNGLKIYGGGVTGASVATGGDGIGVASASEIMPNGVPEIYGNELSVNYDDISADNPQLADATIQKLSEYEDKELSSELLQRYIKIGSSISCEYCCGAQALIFSNGERACGCAHSYAMRGLAKYLLIAHQDMTDEQILEEMGKWKVLFFPGVHEQKAQVLKSKGIELNYINLASNKYRGIEQGQASEGGMVGGC